MQASILITQSIEKLRQLTQVDVKNSWQFYPGDFDYLDDYNASSCPVSDFSNWLYALPNEKGYLTWEAAQVRWLAQRFIVPHQLQGYPLFSMSLRLALTWWAEKAQIWVNGKLVQEGDLFDSSSRILLTPAVTPKEEITVILRLVSPGHDIGALMRSLCLYERADCQSKLAIDPGFVADELTVLYHYINAFEPEKLEQLAAEIAQIAWNTVADATAFDQSLLQLRTTLQPLAQGITQRCLHLLGHAHLDMAWLWTVDETWKVAQRTFSSVLSLQQDFPELTFGHTTSVLYAWIEEHRPELFEAIQQAVAKGRWEILGGMWVEPDVNLPAGESLVRHLLYGQRYLIAKFGTPAKVAWLPDSFGFCWQLPQIFKSSGINYFVTGKLHWNDSNPFPHGIFWWRSPDGTQLLTLMSPPNLAGVMDTNPISMANYAVAWEKQTGLKDALWLPGVGDHGGGPSRDMLQVQQRLAQSPFFPRLQFSTAYQYLQQVSQAVPSQLPVWNDELYLELHRGCYTTHAEQKRFNRNCEGLLYQVELWASLAAIAAKQAAQAYSYPKQELETAWKKVLFNQFHDILPGTSITEVFTEANQVWREVEQAVIPLLKQALAAIATQIHLPPPPHPSAQPLVVFNSLNWNRSEVVACPLPSHSYGRIYGADGQPLSCQRDRNTLRFLAHDVPGVGYRLFWLCQTEAEESIAETKPDFVLENERLRVIVNAQTGDLDSVFDKVNRREVLSGAGNQLQAFQDRGQYWDAWNIDPNYANYPLLPTQLKSIGWIEQGPIQWCIRTVRQLGNSEFCQDYILQTQSCLLKIVTTVDWQESHTLVKVAFPLNLESQTATYEIPCGAIARPTQPQTPAQKAKWEVPALRWADLTDENENPKYGVSLLNDCKYGYDSTPSQLRLTLLRSPCWPDAQADRCVHHFTYALYPHAGNWQSAQTVRRGYELNTPLNLHLGEAVEQERGELPPVCELLNLKGDLVLMALKQSEDEINSWILRCYECHGEAAELSLEGELELEVLNFVDLLEQSVHPNPLSSKIINPWQIASFKLR